MARDSLYGSKVHFDGSTAIEVFPGGEIYIPVIGTTSTTGAASTGTFATGTTNIPAFGISIISPGMGGAGTTYRVLTLDAPSSGVTKRLIFLSSSSSGICNVDAQSGNLFAPFDGTSQSRYMVVSSNTCTGRVTIDLTGLSTTLWLVTAVMPTSGILYGSTVYSSCT
jgi:hypothetical protein